MCTDKFVVLPSSPRDIIIGVFALYTCSRTIPACHTLRYLEVVHNVSVLSLNKCEEFYSISQCDYQYGKYRCQGESKDEADKGPCIRDPE